MDEFWLKIFPITLGTGYARIYDGYPDVVLNMVASQTFDGRLQHLEYVPRVLESPPGMVPDGREISI
ncbi:MAG: hypothetical protein GWN00_35090 [Aliifodinibius sp.]|nr:hypothetical protein [Phycisphaerae bacterium]NIR67281.1 hypothetical protein [candidate division Zixibacteria bacterium]NIT61246.1 hypothetical protein [Fodinibius sp.]NIW49384.1 hypothetical protein [Gammaproteobacteria bacterium]NIS48664.1 hypothetical protein [candidate division Zixibacteria bacterium]